MASSNQSNFLTYTSARAIADEFGAPVYVYDEATLRANAEAVLAFPNAYGLTARYAMKACPNAAVLKLFTGMGLHIDASSGHEVRRAIAAGVAPEKISLSAQEVPVDLGDLLGLGIQFNACSLQQLERYGQLRPGTEVGVRLNPGAGSGGNNRTNVGGPSSSFGIWHEFVPQVKELVAKYDLKLIRIHTHIGSGSDPDVWLKVSQMNFSLVAQFPDVRILNVGGGYKVGRMPDEKTTDLQVIGQPMKEKFEAFAAETGREIRMEVEPGTYLVANAGALLAEVHDVVSTGEDGYDFIKLNTGMTELLRPSIYGAQHPIHLLQAAPAAAQKDYVVVGHCCESGDILTPAPGDPELLATRSLPLASTGDLCVIDGAGAYAAAMTPKHYNSYPEAAEVLLTVEGAPKLIRRRQKLEDIWANEVPVA
ncbi:diaminopimelate decarboxylase [Coraliomargarita parva]|uniref:diaminopimelate decarboxylase n=1 Tax=Coraliomargarita parva TaxID=3014050 RepID=UPI0022B40C24|nr:diaminopimelate decarboxylase [Coraliomargarita parva]